MPKGSPEAEDWLEGAISLTTEIDAEDNLIKRWIMHDGSVQITKHNL